MTFAWPWAFLGLLALPALAAIYWLRQRARRRPVSSLLLWREAPQSRAGGRRVERFEASRLFLIELLILILLVIAAAGPRLPVRDSRRPLVVVLDDSFSMLAGGGGSPRQAAAAALLRELEDGRHGAVTLVAAGERPRVLGAGGDPAAAVDERLEQWRAGSATSRLEPAIALATELGAGRARLLVLSDQAPPVAEAAFGDELPAAGRPAWWAFGRRAPNLALVAAMRGSEGRGATSDSCLVEVANYSSRPAVARLEASVGEETPEEVSRLELAAGETGRVRLQAPRGKELRVRLRGEADDALDLDDEAILLPERRRGVRVALEIGDPGLRQLISEALAASERAIFSAGRAELMITDGDAEEAPGAWRLKLVTRGPAKSFLGPFVLDRGHPLTAGLGLYGVIWGAGPAAGPVNGTPVIAAGDVALLADRETAGGHDLTLFWRPDQSTVQRTPNWPILWWNLLEWRSGSVPGVRAANLRLGGEASIGLAAAGGDAELELPDGSRRRLAVRGGRLQVPAELLGIHRLRHGGRADRWVVNALAAAESDLRGVASGRWGDWSDAAAARWEARSAAWMLLLAAAAGWVLHLFWSGPPHPNPLPQGERGPEARSGRR